MGGLEFGVNQPADIAVLLWTNHLKVQQQGHIYLTMDASQSCIKIRFTLLYLPRTTAGAASSPLGNPAGGKNQDHIPVMKASCLYPIIPKNVTLPSGQVLYSACLPLKNGLATRGHSGKRIPSKPPCPPLGVEASLVSFLEWAGREEQAEGSLCASSWSTSPGHNLSQWPVWAPWDFLQVGRADTEAQLVLLLV